MREAGAQSEWKLTCQIERFLHLVLLQTSRSGGSSCRPPNFSALAAHACGVLSVPAPVAPRALRLLSCCCC